MLECRQPAVKQDTHLLHYFAHAGESNDALAPILPRLGDNGLFEATRLSQEFVRVRDSTVDAEILNGANAVGRCVVGFHCEISHGGGNRTLMLVVVRTAEDLIDVQAGILLFEMLPCADDTVSGIDKGAIHVKEAEIKADLAH